MSLFPDRLPRWTALTAGGLMCGYLVAMTAAEQIWGRPSSTSGLGFFVAPIAGLMIGVGGYLLGLVVRLALQRNGVQSRPAPPLLPVALALLVVLVSVGALLVGRQSVLTLEEARRPRVILDSTLITAVTPPTLTLQDRVDAPVLYDLLAHTPAAPNLDWNGRPVRVTAADESIVITDATGARLATTDLHDFDYITGVHAAQVCTQPDGRQLLAVLVSLRATSHRAMLLLYDAEARLIYQHHLERRAASREAMFTGRIDGVAAFAIDLGLVFAWTCSR